MNLKLIKFLAAVCAGLCFIIVCEWIYAIYAQKQLLSSIQAPDKKSNSAVELPTIELTKLPETSYVELVTRPLFIAGRRPVAESNTNETKPVVAANQPFNWVLNGVYTNKKGLYALLSRTSAKVAKDNFRKLTKDVEIDGWKLTEIEKDKVVLSQGDQKKELPLRKPKPKTAANTGDNSALAPQQIPGQPPQPLIPGQQPPVPNPEQIPVPIPEPSPEEIEPVLEPELIPDESSETYFENNENEQFQ
ncbi:MAG: hypothetical protein IPN42_12570 [Methylococcaceae bacterium]|nr:hypothetical protein [Methylococcaceae bacterium]